MSNSKFDLIWIIPEIIGSLSFVIAALYFLREYAVKELSNNLLLSLFLIGLSLNVLDLGLKWMWYGLNELKKIKFKKKGKE